jgi:hypothetical protein
MGENCSEQGRETILEIFVVEYVPAFPACAKHTESASKSTNINQSHAQWGNL